jgi:hypothetical protein
MTIVAEKGSVIIKSIKVEPYYKAPVASVDDNENLVVIPEGADISQLEISPSASGPYVSFVPSKKYMGDQSQFLRFKATSATPASRATELKFTNSAPVITSVASVSVEFFVTR